MTPAAASAVAPRAGDGTHCVLFRDGKRDGVLHDLDAISDALAGPDRLVWLDLAAPTPENLAVLQREFDLHPLAIEDAQTGHERPKLEPYPNFLFLIVHPLAWVGDDLVSHELAIFAGKRYIATIHQMPAFALDEAERRWQVHDGELGHDAGYMLYTLLDTIVDAYFPIVDRFEERISEVQTALFEERVDRAVALREIFELKNDVHRARRAVVPMRDILQPLVRGDIAYFDRAELPYYRDIYDHVVRAIDQLDSARDLVNNAFDVHLSLVANRQNEVSRQLAVIATIFLPLTYLTGFFGQNFAFMVNGITTAHAFWWIGVGSQVAGLAVLLAYFKRKRWF